jgi:dethiobiotin synthetase
VLNHAVLTVEAVRADGLEVAAVVLNRGAAPPDASRPSNLSDLAEIVGVPVLPAYPIDPRDRAARAALGADLLSGIVRP